MKPSADLPHDPLLNRFVSDFVNQGCHTIILYGSRARGDFTPESDYDLLGIRESGEEIRIGEKIAGHYLDGFTYPESAFPEKEKDFLRLRGGRILRDEKGFGKSLLEKIEVLYLKGPPPLPVHELTARKTWVMKTLERARRGGIEGDFRRIMLLHELISDYFDSNGRWFRGSKEAFRELQTLDPETYRFYAAALKPGASFATLEALVTQIARRDTEG